jgi:hypothetical protein
MERTGIRAGRPHGAWLAAWVLVQCAGCTGDVKDDGSNVIVPGQMGSGNGPNGSGPNGGSGGASSQAGGNGTGGTGTPGTDTNGNPCTVAPLAARAVLITPRQYVNALRDLVGQTAVSDEDAATDGNLDFDIVDRPLVTTASMDRTLRLADGATESIRGKSAAFFGCNDLTDKSCVRDSLTKIARRAFKRPAESTEMDEVMKVYDAAAAAITDDAGESAALYALQAVLVAPSTLYRTEFNGKANASDYALSAYERSAALAALLLDSVPDEDLLTAADDGSIMTADGMQKQVDRLLELPRVQQHVTDLVLTAYRVPRVFETPKDTALFPEYTPALQNSMYEESKRFVEDVLWTRSAPLSELLSSRNTFVDASLAKIYGVPHTGADDAFTPATLPETRAGLLTQASVMTVLSRTDKTSVVARGLFVRGALLCLSKLPPPPASVQSQVQMQLNAKSTQEELAMYRATTSPCMNCHSQFDRFGLLLEAFDPIGKQRDAMPKPIDFTGLSPFSGTVESATAFADQVVMHEQFTRCLAERTLAYALTTAQGGDTSCAAGPVLDTIDQAGGDVHALMSAVAASPALSQRVLKDK